MSILRTKFENCLIYTMVASSCDPWIATSLAFLAAKEAIYAYVKYQGTLVQSLHKRIAHFTQSSFLPVVTTYIYRHITVNKTFMWFIREFIRMKYTRHYTNWWRIAEIFTCISIFRFIPFLNSWTHLGNFQNTLLYKMCRWCSLFHLPGDSPSSSRSFVSGLQLSITATYCPMCILYLR